MKILLSFILLIYCVAINAQTAPVIQWQRCIGGSQNDVSHNIEPTPDGGFIIGGHTTSDDGDITGQHSVFGDALVIKTDAAGNILWRKCYGGSSVDAILNIHPTTDGGYIFTGTTLSNDGDVSGYHGGGFQDIWVVKIDATGNLQWQRTFGGTEQDIGHYVSQTSDGGYIVSGSSRSINGDLPGSYSGSTECWIIKLDNAGRPQWQRRYGGTQVDFGAITLQTSDGGYLFAAGSSSVDGDITCNDPQKVWIVKLDNTGNIQWQQCALNSSQVNSLLQTADGGYVFAGTGSLGMPGRDAWILKTDAAGNTEWEKFLGGSDWDEATGIKQTSDGGYIIAGSTNSPEVDICNIKGQEDIWVIKLNSLGVEEWNKRYGGTLSERPAGYVAPVKVVPAPDGGYMLAGSTVSNDGDVSGNHGSLADIWLVKLSAPGALVLPAITITASKTITCPGGGITFVATPVNGGTNPSYQWKLNGVNIANDNDTVTINIPNNGYIVNCQLTSNSPCVSSSVALSNSIIITVDPSLIIRGFLPANLEVCSYGTLELKPAGVYKTYLWSNNAVTPTISISQPGTYSLQVTAIDDCQGSDTVIVTIKDCVKGFYMPTAFTPNNDGRNDLLKPILGGVVKQYKFWVYNRWGQIIFQTTDLSKRWDGKFKSLAQNANIFIWVCTYQLEGEAVKTEKGTVMVIR